MASCTAVSEFLEIDEVVARMEALLAPLEARGDARRYFHGKAGPAVRWKIWIKGPPRPEEDEG